MKIPSVPPRREPPIVFGLDGLKRYKSARRTCMLSKGLYQHELTLADGFVLSHVSYDGFHSRCRFTYDFADHLLRGFVFFAVRGASKEF